MNKPRFYLFFLSLDFRLNCKPWPCAGVLCLKNTNFRVFTKPDLWLIFVLSQTQNQTY